MKKISVILTTYNGQGVIESTVKSILSQEGNGVDFVIELIAVDDCSTDDTYQLLHQYDCKVLRNPKNSGGPNLGRNQGLKIATGDYICIADQDDTWKKDKIKSILPYIDLASIITSGYQVIDTNSEKVEQRTQSTSEEHVLYDENETFRRKLTKTRGGQNTYLGSLVYSSKLKDIHFEEHFGMVDFDWVLRLFHKQTSLEVCKVLYERQVDSTNLSLNETYRKNDFYYSLLTLEDYEEQYPRETGLAYRRLHGSRARYYYVVGNMKKARRYFLRSQWSTKTILYYLTSFVGSNYVKKHFNVFG